MEFLFEDYWELFSPDPEFANRRAATQRLWNQCQPDRQRAIIEWLKAGKSKCTRNPYFFVLDFRAPRQQTLSPDDYYAMYKTTENRDGWRRVYLENERRSVYVKEP